MRRGFAEVGFGSIIVAASARFHPLPEIFVTEPNRIFVYGTLKRGELRESNWPRLPIRIEWATLPGQLRDLGPYPALLEGGDQVLGELWEVAPQDLPITLRTLDAIEGFGQGGEDLYVRRIVTCYSLAGERRDGFTYYFAHPEDIAAKPLVVPDRDGFCQWSSRKPSKD